MTVINVGQLMRQNAKLDRYKFLVSKDAEKEMGKRLEEFFEIHMQDLCRIATKNRRKTVYPDDVTEFFSYKSNRIGGDVDE